MKFFQDAVRSVRADLPLLVFCCAVSLATAPTAGAEPNAGPNRTEALLQALASPTFAAREQAMEQLASVGSAAVPAVAEAARSPDRELAARSVYVLMKIALGEDWDTEDVAATALMKIASSDVEPAAAKAAEALKKIGAMRRDIAVERMTALGAEFERPDYELGQQLLPSLYTLRLDTGYRGGADGLKYLRWLDNVEQAAFAEETATDEWLTEAARMSRLVSIVVRGGNVTSAGLRPFAVDAQVLEPGGLRRLAILYSDADDTDLAPITAIRGLSEVRLYGTKASNDLAARLEESLPGAHIDVRGGAFLGIQCQIGVERCIVQSVQPNTSAGKIGIRSGDEILEYNGKKVSDFEQLVKLISENRSGDEVEIKFSQNGTARTATVKLGQWQ